MKIDGIKIGLMVAVLAVGCSAVDAGSIYAKRSRTAKSLYADDTARQIGDVITIVISENSTVDNTVERTLENSSDRSSSFDGKLGIDHILPSIPGFTMNQSSKRNLNGKSEYDDTRKFTDRISVIVEDIQPNGNLIVVGYRERRIAGDTQMIQVSGIVRPSDINFDNSISSGKVANFQLVTINDGVSDKYNEPGWLANIFDFFWPF